MWVTLLGSFTVGLFSHLCATSKLAKVITLLGALMNHLEMNRDHSDVFEIACCESAAVNLPANLEKSAVATGLEKVSFHSNPKESNAKECSNYCTMALISHTSKVMLKILQVRLQQYVNCELPDVQAGFRKGRGTRDQIANICWIMEKQESSRKTSISALLTMPKPLTVWITINCGKF